MVPALPIHHDHPAVQQGGVLLDLLHGLFGNLGLHFPAVVVILTDLRGKGFGFLLSFTGQQPHCPLRGAHPAGGVDPGDHGKGQAGGSGSLPSHSALLHQGVHPGPASPGEDGQTSLYNGPVLPQHRHHVGHRAQGSQVGILFHHSAGVPVLQGHDQLQSHPRPGKVLIRAVVIGLVGIYHRIGAGDAFLGAVVVGDNHVYPQLGRPLHFVYRSDAVVHRDNQGDPLLVKGFHGVEVHPVTFPFPLGDIVHHIGTHGLQIGEQDGGGCDAVGVVIAVNRNFLKVVNGPADPLHGLVHVLHQKRVGELPAGKQIADLLLLVHTSDFQQHGQKKREGIPFRQLGGPLFIQGGNLPFFDVHWQSLLTCFLNNYFIIFQRNMQGGENSFPRKGTLLLLGHNCAILRETGNIRKWRVTL